MSLQLKNSLMSVNELTSSIALTSI